MKTIEEAAKERADKFCPVVVPETEISCLVEDLNLWAKNDFKAGAEFIQSKMAAEKEMVRSFVALLLLNIDEFTPKDSMIKHSNSYIKLNEYVGGIEIIVCEKCGNVMRNITDHIKRCPKCANTQIV